ncbi:hypothetical protein [Mycolicibacterium lutetiense]|uniref:Uncharacterized protein n=1 Tax=Mycolicibacterium lutetiense TaxID=1641992 RepID=A0ABS4ZV27_9MYCO|nr:hypothetical protein [Mycolicibacterium lutetiense]MBP2452993.1 hypothetical protein [Mycolicibacterium lutetiense]
MITAPIHLGLMHGSLASWQASVGPKIGRKTGREIGPMGDM